MISKGKIMIYLDYNATSPYSPSVKEYISKFMLYDWANPSSEHDMGYQLANNIKDIRSCIADFLGVSTKSLVFTGSATESINTVLSLDNLRANNIKTIISSKLEHHATLDQLTYLEKNGFEVKFVSNDKMGRLDLNELDKILESSSKAIISFMYVNNETGVINPVEKLSEIAKKHNSLIHIDAVQALGKVYFDLDDLDVDFASFSGHKIGAMKGVGLLYANNIDTLKPLLHGGGQERGFRPSTLNYAAIKSFGLAIEDIDFDSNDNIRQLRDSFESEILKTESVHVNCVDNNRVYNTSNIYLGGEDARAILLNLSRENIMVSTGSACSSGSYNPSHVIQELGYDKDYAASCLRVSLGADTKESDIKTLVVKLQQLFS
jgi:cysteine desulfurase